MRAIDLEPGWALSWPQNTPHRVDNLDGLNVLITTDYFTPSATRKYGVCFANGMRRRRFGLRPALTGASGPGALAKCAMALAVKKLGMRRQNERRMMEEFLLDASAPGAQIDVPADRQRPIEQT